MDVRAGGILSQKEYSFYQDYTGALGALRKPLGGDDENWARKEAFSHTQGSDWAAIVMPCGTGKTTMTRHVKDAQEMSGVNVVDTDAIISKHPEYERYLDSLDRRVERGVRNWTQLNIWRDRMLRERLPNEHRQGMLNVVLVHGRSTTIACGLKELGSIALEHKAQGGVLDRRKSRFGEKKCDVMRTNRDLVAENDPNLHLCPSHSEVKSTLISMLSSAKSSEMPWSALRDNSHLGAASSDGKFGASSAEGDQNTPFGNDANNSTDSANTNSGEHMPAAIPCS